MSPDRISSNGKAKLAPCSLFRIGYERNDENQHSKGDLLQKIEQLRESKVILYVTRDSRGLQTQIAQDVIDLFSDHLDALRSVKKISLILQTHGGNTSAAWNLVNLIHMFCDDFEVISPAKCMSAGTLISLSADRIVMTKQTILGPIDPTLQHPLCPQIPGGSPDARAGVSVEAVIGYLDKVRACKGGPDFEGRALLDLANKVHPLVLGQIFRSRQQIRDLAKRLLSRHTTESNKVKQIIDFLCSESGSHDYTINRREAHGLGLNVEECAEDLYKMLKTLRKSYAKQMQLGTPFDIGTLAKPGCVIDYKFTRALIETAEHGAHHFVSSGRIEASEVIQDQPSGGKLTQIAIRDNRRLDGWEKTV